MNTVVERHGVAWIAGVGARAGLGAALARAYSEGGLTVALTGRTPDRVETVAADIRKAGGRAHAIAGDVRVEAEVRRIAAELLANGRDPQSAQGLIFTGATASLRGGAKFAAFASSKAALRSLAQSLAREFGPQGIHVAHVVIDGGIDGDRLRASAPQRVTEAGVDGLLDPAAIADTYWQLHKQHRSAWTFELDVRPFKEHF